MTSVSTEEDFNDGDIYPELLARRNAVKDIRARYEAAKKRSIQVRAALDLSYSEEQTLSRELDEAVARYLEIT